jgi:hypothetical protein
MTKNQKSIILGLIATFIVFVLPLLSINIGGNKTEKVREIIEKSLYEDYGEEFVVDRIGMRSAAGEKFYQARIYPKSIIGTEKENDKYYYSTASVEIGLFGKLYGVGDNFSDIKRNDEMEEYLKPKVKEIFGNRIRLKVNVTHQVTGDKSWWADYGSATLKEMNDMIKKDPEHNRMLLTLYIYIFDRIDNEEEKEKRREEIFEYINYLKKEGLFEYLEMGVIFVDERVLAPSYAEYDRKIFITEDVKELIDGEIVYLPPKELREEMSRVLGEEVSKMSEEELIENMNKIRKSDLDIDKSFTYNEQFFEWIISLTALKIKYPDSYEDEKNSGTIDRFKYTNKNKINFAKHLKYIYY